METIIIPKSNTKSNTEFNKQELLEKFSKILDRAEEIIQWEEFKAYETAVDKAPNLLDMEHYTTYIKPYIDRMTAKLEFGNSMDSTALLIAMSGNNWL